MGDPFDSDPIPGADLRTVLTVVLDKYLQYLAARDRSDLLAERLELFLRTLVDAFNKNQLSTPGPFSGSSGREPLLLSEARYLKICRHTDGSAMIHIDAEIPFRLPRGLADFLEHLAFDEAASDDPLVGWKSRESLWEWLRRHSGRPVSRSYVNKRVNDLRLRLLKAGIVRDLVHRHRTKGVRFALRRTPLASPHIVGGAWK